MFRCLPLILLRYVLSSISDVADLLSNRNPPPLRLVYGDAHVTAAGASRPSEAEGVTVTGGTINGALCDILSVHSWKLRVLTAEDPFIREHRGSGGRPAV